MARPRKASTASRSSTALPNGPITPKTSTSKSPSKSPPPSATFPMAPPPRPSHVPSYLRLPLVFLISTSLSALLHTLSSLYLKGDLATVSKVPEGPGDIAIPLVYRCVELAYSWYLGYDAWDALSLTILTRTPIYSLLMTFYDIRPTTIMANITIEILSFYLPFRLFRPLSPSHASHPRKELVSNRSILTDIPTTISTSLLASIIYALVLYLAYVTFLGEFLVDYFEDLRSLTMAHLGATVLPILFISFIPAGYAARSFLFVPSTAFSHAAPYGTTHSDNSTFDPATATFGQTIYHNVWGGFSRREKILIKRASSLVIMVAINAIMKLFGEIRGVTLQGASGWGALWNTATILVAATYLWVGSVEGV